jgi:predicted metal-dependent phosphoesterase TrpH
LAHPGRYTAGRKAMGKSTLQELLAEFVLFGGRGVEVVTGSHTIPQYAEFARYATQYGLLSSCGSDFHGPEESYRDLGRLPDLPMECTPIWSQWEAVPV